MAKSFQRALLLCPGKYSLYNSLLAILSVLAEECKGYDVQKDINNSDLKIHSQIYRFPYKIRKTWEKYFLQKINKIILNEINMYNPDFVMVYNSEFLLPETCSEIKKRAKLLFFMGDSPFYTPVNNHYLVCLEYADLILSPDTFWNYQLSTIGLHKTIFFAPGIDSSHYFEITEGSLIKNIPESEVFYSGLSYTNSWGYKKALFMNQFVNFNLHIYGSRHWKKWFREFPALENKYTETYYIPVELLNKMMNKSKIIPVDGNPGILNGFHMRLLEALGSGSLPLIEYRYDVKHELFQGSKANIPLIHDYRKAGQIADYYLKNETERKELVKELKNFISRKYSPEMNAERILNSLIK